MTHDSDDHDGGFLLLACGTSGRWRVDVDESTGGTEWSIQLDAPQIYLDFSLQELEAVRRARDYLRDRTRTGPLSLGRFDNAEVSLYWDDEDFDRCFLIVGAKARGALRITLDVTDTDELAAALDQVIEDLPPEDSAD